MSTVVRSSTLIGVPPGVGDLYWCLTKLKAFKQAHGIERVVLAIQKTSKDRAIEWKDMVDFVDDARYVHLTPGRAAVTGLERKQGPFDFVMWPNAIVDRGDHLSTWMPTLELDLDFPVKTRQIIAPNLENRVVLYASALGVNKAWFPDRRGDFWIQLAVELAQRFGERPVLIGAAWDEDNHESLMRVHTQSILGRTSLAEVAWLIEHARAVIGVISGMTILANHFKRPTIAFAPNKHAAVFPYTWVREQPWYTALRPASMGDPAECARILEAMVQEKERYTCSTLASSSALSTARSS